MLLNNTNFPITQKNKNPKKILFSKEKKELTNTFFLVGINLKNIKKQRENVNS